MDCYLLPVFSESSKPLCPLGIPSGPRMRFLLIFLPQVGASLLVSVSCLLSTAPKSAGLSRAVSLSD